MWLFVADVLLWLELSANSEQTTSDTAGTIIIATLASSSSFSHFCVHFLSSPFTWSFSSSPIPFLLHLFRVDLRYYRHAGHHGGHALPRHSYRLRRSSRPSLCCRSLWQVCQGDPEACGWCASRREHWPECPGIKQLRRCVVVLVRIVISTTHL